MEEQIDSLTIYTNRINPYKITHKLFTCISSDFDYNTLQYKMQNIKAL
jgi:hypothetical protein